LGLGPRGDCPLPNTACPLKIDVVVEVEVEAAATVGATRGGAVTTLGFVDITDIGEVRLNLYKLNKLNRIIS